MMMVPELKLGWIVLTNHIGDADLIAYTIGEMLVLKILSNLSMICLININ